MAVMMMKNDANIFYYNSEGTEYTREYAGYICNTHIYIYIFFTTNFSTVLRVFRVSRPDEQFLLAVTVRTTVSY